MKVTAAKKNIFTEKVLTIDPKDAEKVAEAVKASGKVFTISYPHRTFPTLRAVKSFDGQRQAGPCDLRTRAHVHNGSSANWLPRISTIKHSAAAAQ